MKSLLLVVLEMPRFASSDASLPNKDLKSWSSYQLNDGIRSPPVSGWPHMIFEKALKRSPSAALLSGVRRLRATLISVKLDREEICWRVGGYRIKKRRKMMEKPIRKHVILNSAHFTINTGLQWVTTIWSLYSC